MGPRGSEIIHLLRYQDYLNLRNNMVFHGWNDTPVVELKSFMLDEALWKRERSSSRSCIKKINWNAKLKRLIFTIDFI